MRGVSRSSGERGVSGAPASAGAQAVAGFVQVVDFSTSKIDQVETLGKRMQDERGEGLLARKVTLTADRDHPHHYLLIVEFNSYDEAMRNSSDPVTDRYAAEMEELLDGPPTFHNLDVRTVTTVR